MKVRKDQIITNLNNKYICKIEHNKNMYRTNKPVLANKGDKPTYLIRRLIKYL